MPFLNCIIDLSHHNSVTDLAAAKAAGISNIIHKATEGASYVDGTYPDRRAAAQAQQIAWGCYHFGLANNIPQQVDHFLNHANPGPADLIALDWEPSSDGPVMQLSEAEQFVQLVHDKTGRWPVLYSGTYFLGQQLTAAKAESPLFKCRLWLAQYSPQPPQPPGQFKLPLMWQYTDGSKGNPPHAVPGIGLCDRDIFISDDNGLSAWWPGSP